MGYSKILLERWDDVSRITLARPEAFNAYDLDLARELELAMESCGRDPLVKAVILTGEGKAFCSGGDIKEMHDWMQRRDEPVSALFQRLTRHLHATVVEMRRMPKPVIAAINGVAAGAGFSLAMACDLRLAVTSARFTQAYTRIGLVPDGGSSYFLPRLVGPARAAELMFLNRVLTAQEALQWGLVSRLVEQEALEQEALGLARQLARGPGLAHGLLKGLLRTTWESSLEGQLEEERRSIVEASLSPDFQEGIQAFLNKREPKFGK
jgi:2-(1,2-epoxy-1,2-dihydrophenyl)acetyl-CoA isomerase